MPACVRVCCRVSSLTVWTHAVCVRSGLTSRLFETGTQRRGAFALDFESGPPCPRSPHTPATAAGPGAQRGAPGVGCVRPSNRRSLFFQKQNRNGSTVTRMKRVYTDACGARGGDELEINCGDLAPMGAASHRRSPRRVPSAVPLRLSSLLQSRACALLRLRHRIQRGWRRHRR